MDEQNELERSISDAIDDEPHQNARTECRKRVFLFNCDKLYSLDSMEKLLLNMKGDIRQQLSFDIVKTSFRLSEMSHVAEKAIPKLQMDVAFFVVHANEPCLSINEENAGIGYAKIYKALLRATGKSMTYSFMSVFQTVVLFCPYLLKKFVMILSSCQKCLTKT